MKKQNDLISAKEVLFYDEAQEAQEAQEVTGGRPLLRVLSLGAGVQSSTLYLMALAGEFGEERPTVAVFADTQWEPAATYAWLDELERIGGDVIPIQRVTVGSLRADIVEGVNRGYRIANMPFFTAGADGRASILRRTCTSEYKITPLKRATRAMLDAIRPPGRLAVGAVEQWVGISTDEATRMKDSDTAYVVNRYPLIEIRMSRADCLTWLSFNGYPHPPKSACIGCPFHDDPYWLDMRENRPDEWRNAVEFDVSIREVGSDGMTVAMRGMRNDGKAFLHRSLLPLDQVPLSQEEKAAAGDAKRPMFNMWENECEGMCGV